MNKYSTVNILNTLVGVESIKTYKAYTPKGVWQTGQTTVKDCEVFDASVCVVLLKPGVYIKIQELMKRYTNVEWLAYLIGKKTKGGYEISNLVIPKQEQSIATVDLDPNDTIDLSSVVGTIHSHHNMGAFFSSTDDSYIVPNHPVAIVISHSGWACKVRQPLPCGNFIATEVSLVMSQPVKINLTDFLKTVEEKITLKVYPLTTTVSKVTSPYTWEGYTCLSCKRTSKDTTAFVWQGFGCYCKTCVATIGDITEMEWVELTKMIKEAGKADKSKETNTLVPAGITSVQCSWCNTFAPKSNMLALAGDLVCRECYNETFGANNHGGAY